MFLPPFCPYEACRFHRTPPPTVWWSSCGSHHTRCFGTVPRFKCSACRRTFSTQTFSLDYYAKRKLPYRRIERLNASSLSIRSLSRDLACSCGSILNRLDRLSRQELAGHTRLAPLASLPEDICIDGFVGFDRSQYFPNNITISITSHSRYALAFSHATLRRSGSMRESQKIRRDYLYRDCLFEAKALERSFTELLDNLAQDRRPRPGRPLVIISDEKLEYLRAFHRHPLFTDQDESHRCALLQVSSKLPRTIFNPLFASNYLDREIRKDQAAHRRESTCFCRCVANGLSRMACYLGWHNYAKRYLIKARTEMEETHAEEAGISRKDVRQVRSEIFRKRAFLSLEGLGELERRVWLKSSPTPGQRKPAYLPRYAVA